MQKGLCGEIISSQKPLFPTGLISEVRIIHRFYRKGKGKKIAFKKGIVYAKKRKFTIIERRKLKWKICV